MGEITTRGGSMAPLILPGDKLILKQSQKYVSDDIVVFKKEKRFIAHRVVYSSKLDIVTKGDRNPKDDGYISKQEILGIVDAVKRGGRVLKIDHFYLSQSAAYLKELSRISRYFKKAGISCVFIKGLPVHLFFENSPPRRLYLDADILIKKDKAESAYKSLEKLGFRKVSGDSPAWGRSESPTQITFFKKASPFPVIIDLHLELAVGFTRATLLNRLLPDFKWFSDLVFKECESFKSERGNFKVPKKEIALVISLIHFFHHNYRGANSLKWTKGLMGLKPDMSEVARIIKKGRLNSILFPATFIVNKYYPQTFSEVVLRQIRPNVSQRLFSLFLQKISWPFSEEAKTAAGIKRMLLILFLSPLGTRKKFRVLFSEEVLTYFLSTIRSLLVSFLTKSSKSRAASL